MSLFYKNANNGHVHEVEEGSASHDNVEALANWSKVDAPESAGDEPVGGKVQAGPANGSFGEANGREQTANAVVEAATEKPEPAKKPATGKKA